MCVAPSQGEDAIGAVGALVAQHRAAHHLLSVEGLQMQDGDSAALFEHGSSRQTLGLALEQANCSADTVTLATLAKHVRSLLMHADMADGALSPPPRLPLSTHKERSGIPRYRGPCSQLEAPAQAS